MYDFFNQNSITAYKDTGWSINHNRSDVNNKITTTQSNTANIFHVSILFNVVNSSVFSTVQKQKKSSRRKNHTTTFVIT